jgi:hypothetical protein
MPRWWRWSTNHAKSSGGRSGGSGRKAGHLVAPRAVERVLGDGHQLDVGEAHLHDVVGQLRGELPVGERPAGRPRASLPGAEVHLVDRQRPVEPVPPRRGAGAIQAVAPGELARIADDRRVAGGARNTSRTGRSSCRIGALGVADLELVELALAQAGDEELPDPGGPERAHRVVAAVPAVEVARRPRPARRRGPTRRRRRRLPRPGPKGGRPASRRSGARCPR